MTRSHRRAHLAAWLVLAPAILMVLIAGLLTRARVAAARGPERIQAAQGTDR